MRVLYFISRKTLRRLLTAPALQGEGRDRVAAVVRGFPKPLGAQCLAEFTEAPHLYTGLGARNFKAGPGVQVSGRSWTLREKLRLSLRLRGRKAGVWGGVRGQEEEGRRDKGQRDPGRIYQMSKVRRRTWAQCLCTALNS